MKPNKIQIGDTVIEYAQCERCGHDSFYIRVINIDNDESEMVIKCLACDAEYRRTTYQPNTCILTISDVGINKISVIRAVREVTEWGLKESKDWVESVQKTVPREFTARDFTRGQLVKFSELLTDAGATVKMRIGNNCDTCQYRFKCFTSR